MKSNSYVVRKERCPLCAREGKDTSQDNLVVYSDGHSYCYGHGGLVVGVSGISFLTNKEAKEKHEVVLPFDCEMKYPKRTIDWINSYELDKSDLLTHNVFWSESCQRLIFSVFGDIGLIAYQGRYFGTDKKPKWYGKGNLKNTFNILGNTHKTIVLVEDIISAIKVSKVCGSMPLYGSFIGLERFKRLFKMFGKEVDVVVWLDFDKKKESVKESNLGRLCGLNCRSIFTVPDPKEISLNEIKKLLTK